MKGRVEMNTLVVLVVLALGASVCDGLVVDKCKLRDQLNSTLPASLLNQTNMLARIACFVEMRSGFNTSAINQNVSAEDQLPSPGRHNGRHRRLAPGSKNQESGEETSKNPKNGSTPKPLNPATGQKGNGSSSGINGNGTAGGQGANGNGTAGGQGANGNGTAGGQGANGNGTAGGQGANGNGLKKSPKEANGHGSRHRRSAPEASSHSQHESQGPNNKQSGNGGKGGRGASGSSEEESEEESGEKSRDDVVWTLYGLFQLPDSIACTSGATPSLNLCNTTCDSFLNDDISDDITCMGIILNKLLTAGKPHVPVEGAVMKYFDGAFQSCKSMVDLQYFSTC